MIRALGPHLVQVVEADLLLVGLALGHGQNAPVAGQCILDGRHGALATHEERRHGLGDGIERLGAQRQHRQLHPVGAGRVRIVGFDDVELRRQRLVLEERHGTWLISGTERPIWRRNSSGLSVTTVSVSSAFKPAPRATRRAKGSESKSPGACASLLTSSRAPDDRASAGHVSVRERVPPARRQLQPLAVALRQLRQLRAQQTRVHQRMHVVGLQRGAVGAGGDRFGDGLAVDGHKLGPGLGGLARHRVDFARRHVRDLDARHSDDAPGLLRDAAIAGEGRHQHVDVGGAGVIRHGHGGVARDVTAPQKLDRRKLAIAQEGVRVEVEEHEEHAESPGSP